MSLKRIMWEEANHVESHPTLFLADDTQLTFLHISKNHLCTFLAIGVQREFILFPSLSL